MPIKERLAGLFPNLPDIGAMQDMFNQRFEELIAELKTMQGILADILVEVKKQTQGGTTP